jgi:3-isopropylmalate dehydrogenase
VKTVKFNITVTAGDGIGPEVVAEGVKAMDAVGRRFGHKFNYDYQLLGGIAIDKTGSAMPDETLKSSKKSDAVLLGAVGGPKWDDPKAKTRPEDGLLAMRKDLGLFANLRPVGCGNVKADVVKGTDMVVIRELTGGLYFGKPKKQWTTTRGRRAVDTMMYTEEEIERILRVGFELARGRRKKLTSIDKSNVLQTSRLWRQIAMELSPEYPDIELDHMLVDSAAMRLIQNPTYFDVAVTENTFGDILTDEASMLAGSMGMLPSASLNAIPKVGAKIFGMYEPIHGSAPSRANLNMANPIATIMSTAMLLRHSLALIKEADAIEKAVEKVLEAGYRTYDIMSEGMTKLGTKEMGDAVAAKLEG